MTIEDLRNEYAQETGNPVPKSEEDFYKYLFWLEKRYIGIVQTGKGVAFPIEPDYGRMRVGPAINDDKWNGSKLTT